VTFKVVTTPEADHQVRTIDSWWRENRTAAPDLFSEELAAGLDFARGHSKHGPKLRSPDCEKRPPHSPSLNAASRVLRRARGYGGRTGCVERGAREWP
jgi:hypothetical protein